MKTNDNVLRKFAGALFNKGLGLDDKKVNDIIVPCTIHNNCRSSVHDYDQVELRLRCEAPAIVDLLCNQMQFLQLVSEEMVDVYSEYDFMGTFTECLGRELGRMMMVCDVTTASDLKAFMMGSKFGNIDDEPF